MNGSYQPVSRLSLPRQIAERLRREIETRFKSGDRLASMRELRQRFGVSINTVGSALDLLARDGLIEKRHGSGVYVAPRSRPRVGILSELNLFHPGIGRFFPAVADALKARLAERGLDAHLYVGTALSGLAEPSDSTAPAFWADAASGLLQGAVILNGKFNAECGNRIRSLTIPAVGDMTDYRAILDAEGIVAAAVRRLAARGCRRLGLLSWQVVEPFRRAVEACGVTTADAWIRSRLNPAVRGTGWDEFREIWLAGGVKPDGLIILDDMLFYDAQMAMFELGVRVPRDLRLAVQTSRNASPPSRLPVDALEVDPLEMASELADLLAARMGPAKVPPVMRRLAFREIPAAGAGRLRLARRI